MTAKNKRSQIGLIIHWIGSRNVSVYIMVGLILLFIVWLLPFQFYGVPHERIQNIATKTWLFRVGYLVFLINVIFCLWQVMGSLPQKITKLRQQPYVREDITRLPVQFNYSLTGINWPATFSLLVSRLKLRGYRVTVDNGRYSLYGIRGRWAPVGNVLFHLSFVILAIGIGISLYSGFYGETLITEGQTFKGTESAFYTSPPKEQLTDLHGRLPDISFRLDRVQPTFWQNKLLFTDLLADIAFPVPEMDSFYTLRLNQPFYSEGTFISLKGFGYSPYYVLKNKTGKIISQSFVTLTVFPSGAEDSFKIPDQPYEIHVIIWSDPLPKRGNITTKSYNLTHPLYQLYILKGEQNQLVYQGIIQPGDAVQFDGYSLSFPEIRYYGEFRVIRNPGIPVIFGAFLLGCIGLVGRLFYYRREVLALILDEEGQPVLYLGGSSDYYTQLFGAELKNLLADLTQGAN
ncbi:MAG: cytochrome c biogenesis protein ResB [Carboxydocellales bacterium]